MTHRNLPTRALRAAFALGSVVALSATAGCSGTYRTRVYATSPSVTVVDAPPQLVATDEGVWVVAGYDDPVFYEDDYYWRYDGGTWYRSSYLGGWSPVATVVVPAPIVSIRSPARYRHYRAPERAPVRVAPRARVEVRGSRPGARVEVRGPRPSARVEVRGSRPAARVEARSPRPSARVEVRGARPDARVEVRSADRGRGHARGHSGGGSVEVRSQGRGNARGHTGGGSVEVRSEGRGRGNARGQRDDHPRGNSGRGGARVRVRGDG